jgi:dihydroxy-acid dehydratase
VWEAGGVPLNLPMVSLGENQMRPTAMLWRNMAAMAAEELLRANPIDGVVLLGGCDKTIPRFSWRLRRSICRLSSSPADPCSPAPSVACHSDAAPTSGGCRRRCGRGRFPQADFLASESAMIRSRGHCNTMGTASTMACMAESLGTTLPGTAGIPAADSRLLVMAQSSGRLAVELVESGRRPSTVLTRGSFLNAVIALAAIGGSTNAVVHLLAIAGRLGSTCPWTTSTGQGPASPCSWTSIQPAVS